MPTYRFAIGKPSVSLTTDQCELESRVRVVLHRPGNREGDGPQSSRSSLESSCCSMETR
jgi:hypothetical protein